MSQFAEIYSSYGMVVNISISIIIHENITQKRIS